MDYYATLAIDALGNAGHAVTPADRVPGLFDVAGIARDVTVGQLWQLSQQHGRWNASVDTLPKGQDRNGLGAEQG